MIVNIDKLRELAENATPGPYRIASTTPGKTAVCAGPGLALVANRLTRPDAEFIAAANPAAVLVLLDELDNLVGMVQDQAGQIRAIKEQES